MILPSTSGSPRCISSLSPGEDSRRLSPGPGDRQGQPCHPPRCCDDEEEAEDVREIDAEASVSPRDGYCGEESGQG